MTILSDHVIPRSLRLSSGGEFSKKYPLIRASYEAKGSRGLFVLGTASHSVDYRKSAGGFIHGFRYTGEWAGTATGHTENDLCCYWGPETSSQVLRT